MPTVGVNTMLQLDDDALGGIAGDAANGDDVEATDLTGTLAHTYGADGAGTVLLTGVDLPTAGEFDFDLSSDGKTLTITQDQGGTDPVAVQSIVLTDTTSGEYTVNQLAAIMHPEGDTENNVEFTINYQVMDSDGDTADGTLAINVDDDMPVAFTPDAQLISNVGGGVITGDLNTIPGADGAESIVISTFTYDGTTYTADGTTTLTSNENVISLTGIGTNVITGATGEGTVFTMTLDDSVDGYSFNLVQPIDDGSGITPIEMSGVNSGNPVFMRSDSPTEDFDLLFSAKTDGIIDTVNTSQGAPLSSGSVGVGGGQTLSDGNLLAIDFVTDLTIGTTTGNQNYYDHTGHHSLGKFSFEFNGSGDVIVRAYESTTDDPPGTDEIVHHDALWESNDLTQQQIDSITINGEPVVASSLTPDGFGGYIISGVATGDVITVSVSGGFNRLEIENSTSPEGDTYDVGNFGYTEVAEGDSINVDFGLTLTDGDGDTSTGSIDLTIEPALQASILEGGDFDDTLAYDPLDTIDGGAGIDTLLVADASVLDFSHVTNIEKIEMADDGMSQTISLTAEQVLDMSSGDALEILGGSYEGAYVDTVSLDSDWTQVAGSNVFDSSTTDASITVFNVTVDLDGGTPVQIDDSGDIVI